MNEIKLVDLKSIKYSRFKTEVIDLAKVAEIAESLKSNRDNGTRGLLQIPTARLVDGKYELSFGHHRLEAFVLNAKEDKFFSQMPLIICELTDLQSFQLMVIEDFKRRDISILEKARRFHTYMTAFKPNHTSVEAAQFFDVPEETVRGTIRLLSLPDLAQKELEAGNITIETGRNLLTVNRLAGQKMVDEVLKGIIEQHGDPEEVIRTTLLKSAQYLRGSPWLNIKNFPVKYLEPLAYTPVAIALKHKKENHPDLKEMMRYIESGMEITNEAFPQFEPGDLEYVRVLVNPPTCTTCPLHAQINGVHYCGLKPCYERKKKAWDKNELMKVSKATGIPMYSNDANEGRSLELSRWDDTTKKLFKEHHPDVRLKETTRTIYNNLEGLPENVVLVATGKLVEKISKAKGKAEEKEDNREEEENRKRELRIARSEAINRFAWEVAAPAFGALLNGVTNVEFLSAFYEESISTQGKLPGTFNEREFDKIYQKLPKAGKLKELRRMIMFHDFFNRMNWDAKTKMKGNEKPVQLFAKYIQTLAQDWRLKLPKDFLDQAKKFDKAIEDGEE